MGRRLAVALSLLAVVSWPAAAAAAPATFTLGITDPVYLQAHGRNAWLDRTVASGARLVLLWVAWGGVSPARPPAGTNPSDPANPAYNWGTLDDTVRAARARGLTVVLGLTSAPAWAEGARRPRRAEPGTWRPDPAAFGAFAKAVARRYSGTFGTLPRVRYFEAWAEPNLPEHLTPQWVRMSGHWRAESPIIYRRLLNAFYAGVKSVHAGNRVISAGTAPYGDDPGGLRMPPVRFVRELLCLRGRTLVRQGCPHPAHFDILAHDPYTHGGPFQPAFNAENVSLPDMGKLRRVLAAAERTGRALPHKRHPMWVTEFGWVSNPPSRGGVPARDWGRWMEQAFYVLWRQGVDRVIWYQIVDPRGSPHKTGLYLRDGRPKVGMQAFRFPFLARRAGAGRVQVWGVAPRAGVAAVQLRRSGRWRTIMRVRVRAHGVIHRAVGLGGRPLLRARIGADTSLGWRL